LIFIGSVILLLLVSVIIDILTPESLKISRRREKQSKDSVIRTLNQERRFQHKEEQRKKHLSYVIARFSQKDLLEN
jgi:hypothetical protein